MSETAFNEFANSALALSYEQRLNLILLLANSLKNNQNITHANEAPTDEYTKMSEVVARSSMSAMWEELKDDTW